MGESSFWYRPTRVVPDQRPLNGRCVVVLACFIYLIVICFDLAMSMTFMHCMCTSTDFLIDILFSRIMLMFLSLSLFEVTFCIAL